MTFIINEGVYNPKNWFAEKIDTEDILVLRLVLYFDDHVKIFDVDLFKYEGFYTDFMSIIQRGVSVIRLTVLAEEVDSDNWIHVRADTWEQN